MNNMVQFPANRPKVLIVSRAVVINPNGEILILLRSPREDEKVQNWEFPGGKLDIGETIQENLLREVIEETGLQIKPSGLQFVRQEIPIAGKYLGFIVITITEIAKCTKLKITLSKEHTDYKWMKPRKILKIKNLSINVSEPLKHFLSTKQIN